MSDFERQKAQREIDARTYAEWENIKWPLAIVGVIGLVLTAVGALGYWLLSLV